MTLFGMLLFSRGLGNIASTPISSALTGLASSSAQEISGSKLAHFGSGFDVAGGRFSTTIVYVGTCFAVAGMVVMCGWVADVYRRRS